MTAQKDRNEIQDYMDALVASGKSGQMEMKDPKAATAYIHKINRFRRSVRQNLQREEGMSAFSPYDLFTIKQRGKVIVFEYDNPFESIVTDPETGDRITYKDFLDRQAAKSAEGEPSQSDTSIFP